MATKKKIAKLKREIARAEKKLKRLNESEAKARDNWTKGYQRYCKAASDLAGLTRHGTKKEQGLKDIIYKWNTKTAELTKKRDNFRQQIRETEDGITELKIQLAKAESEMHSRQDMHDEIVEQVFALNDRVVEALEARNAYLSGHVYGYLIDEQGNLRRQVTFINSEGVRKVVAMVNSITLLEPTLATEAQKQIEKFFARFKTVEMDEQTQALYELTQKLLTEKRTFKVGETLYRFLTLKLTKKAFPELVQAQELLKAALRSEKTDSYIRLYERKDTKSPWKQVQLK